MIETLRRLGRHWHAQGIAPRSGVSQHELEAFEASAGVRMASDVRAYFDAFDGTNEGALDAQMIAFWPLARVRTVAAELGPQEVVSPQGTQFFCFADFSLWCNAYAVRMTANGDTSDVVAVYSGAELIRIAQSFEEFLHAYLGPTPEEILHPRRAGAR